MVIDMTAVYRVYKDGALIYVGASCSPSRRIAEHGFIDDVTVRIKWYDMRSTALLVERRMIRRFKPALNVQFNDGHTPSPTVARRGLSGQVPQGDVRLTANMNAALHIKLKVAAAKRRTTVGALIEHLIEAHL